MTKILGIAILFAAALSAQSYGFADATNCSQIAGWAYDSTQPNNAISVDVYDNGVLLVSPLANLFRQDLLNAGVGNGYHAYSIATPSSLKDGHSHYITIYFHGTSNALGGAGTSTTIACAGNGPGYQYYYTDALTSINTNNWTQNGVGSAGTSGYTSGDANGGSLISKIPVPDGSGNYEVKMKLSIPSSGGTYVTYQRATSNALAANGNAGSFYAVQIQNPTFSQSGAACTATLLVSKSVAGTVTSLWGSTITCHSVMSVRTVISSGNYFGVYVDNREVAIFGDSSITVGQAGVGVIGAPAGNVISEVDLGPLDRVAPQGVNAQLMSTSSFANRVDFAWQGAADDANGTGIAYYWIYRNGTYLANMSSAAYTDSTVSPGTSYSYMVIANDYHLNWGPALVFNVTTPPAGSVDPRQVGVRPTGTYWGAAGEQIDLRSGNLNFRLPLVKAAGRGGSGFALGLSYNSTNWRQDPGGTWQLGHDVGYGYGWKLQAGSLLPVYTDFVTIHHYVFTDASGAEYRLDQNTNGVWTSKEGIYASYDSSTQRLYFPDGTFWLFGAVSAGTEEDAGTLYPTLFQDTNGNQILLRYGAASGLPWTGSSARIVQVEDVRAGGTPPATYNFTYNTDTIPHLTSIANTIGTAETYTFTLASQTLISAFSSTSYGPINTLASVKQTGTGQTTSFTYGSTGSLFQMNTPFGGYIRWAYTNSSYAGGILQREVQNRYLVKSSGSPEVPYPITRTTPGASAAITDPGGQGQKVWNFQTNTSLFNFGLVTSYDQQQMPGATTKIHNDFTWVQDSAGNPYLGTTITTLDPTQSYAISKKSTQTLDSHGNATQTKLWNFYTGTPPTNPARTYTNTYQTDNGSCAYSSLYIFNRLTQSTLTDGTNTTTLVTNQYGANISDAPSIREHDPNYDTSYFCRGNLISSTTPSGTATTNYDIAGNVTQHYVNGELTTNTVSSSTNYAVPSAMTIVNLTSSVNYTGFLAPSSATGPNGESASINYDSLARPQSSVSPYGATTTYAYNDTAPATRTATTNGHWTRTTLDGFGRNIKTEIGDSGGTKSTVDTVYDSCACNPMGKIVKTSMPFAPNATVYWKQNTYDGLGRTVSAIAVDGSHTDYAYQGNTVQVTDPAGKWKKFTMDALGNLTSVLEPDPLNQPSGTLTTTYAYDLLSHLTTVTMPRATGTQTRTFNYRTGTTVGTLLLSATNPENGTVTYTYNTDKTLATKTDALNQQFSLTYDNYKRVTQVNLGQTVIRQFYYDTNPLDSTGTFSQYANGRLTAVQSAPTANADTFIEMYSYSQPGEIATKRLRLNRTVQSHPFTLDLDATYSYDNEGKMTSVTYPQSFYNDGSLQPQPSPVTTYTYGFDTMGRPTSMTGPGVDGWGNPATVNIVNNVQFGPANELLQMSYFGSTESRQYNTRLQMTHLTVPGQLNVSYNFAAQNNGQISSQTDNLSGEQITYQYDALKRLYSASGSTWSQTFTYDGFGNLTDKIGTGGAPTNHSPANAATNQLTGYSYDANGNLLTTGYGWDPENRMSYATWGGTQYAYDSANKRIWTGNYTCPGGFCGPGYGWQFQSETVFFYGIDGKQLASYTPQVKYVYGTPQSIYYLLGEERVYFGKYIGNANTSLMSGGTAVGQDRLGSVGKYFPYGEDRSGAPNDTVKFATYTRDSATGLDYADQRYYTSGLGRFLTMDRSAASLSLANPQSWNRYAYVLGDPANHNDPSGLCTAMFAGITMGIDDGSPFDHEQMSLSAVAGFPYSGQGPVASVVSVVSQASFGPNGSTIVALATLRDALDNNTGSIDVIAYSGGAQAFATALGQLSPADQARIGNILYISPGMVGTLPTPSGAGNATVVEGWNYDVDPWATMGMVIPMGVKTIKTACDHTDLGCLLGAAPLAQITADGPCKYADIFTRSSHRIAPSPPVSINSDHGGGWNPFDLLFLLFGNSNPSPDPDPPPPSVQLGYR